MSCPKLLFSCIFHFTLTLRAGLHVPNTDIIAATLQAQTAHLASVRRSHVSNDATHHDVLDGLAVRAEHRRNLLTEQPSSLIHLSLIATGLASIFPLPGHSTKQLLPNPQHGYSTNYAEDEVREIAFAKQLDVQQVTDESTNVTADDTHNKVHAASLAFTAHNAIGNITDENASQYRPSRKFCNVF